MSRSGHFVLAAGGTGGHLVPAHALAAELRARGHRATLVTDARGAKIPGLFGGVETRVLPAGRIARNPLALLRAARDIAAGRAMALALYRELRPAAAVGFGGYPAFPALLAAKAAGLPTAVHEQNAVLGRVNRLVAGRVDAIATAYPEVDRLSPRHRAKATLVGNPIRAEVLAIRDEPYPALAADGVLRLLVTGGSQGASVLSEVVPAAVGLLPENLRHRLQVTQQCRPEDLEAVCATYRALGVPAELATYFPDLPQRLGWAHLVVARAGASTIADLTAAGRPAILVPLPSAADDHQTANAREMAKLGGARVIGQAEFTAERLAREVEAMVADPESLAAAADRARACGRPRAAEALADLVERLAGDALLERAA